MLFSVSVIDEKKVKKECEMNVEQINSLLKNHFQGMLMLSNGYRINGHGYFAFSLSIGNETFLEERDEILVVPTFFQRSMLVDMTGDPDEIVKVDVEIDPKNVISTFIFHENAVG